MTSITTATGLLSLLGAETPAVAKFGLLAAAGVMLCLVFTYSVIPVLLHLLPDSPSSALRETERWDGILASFIEFPIAYPKSVLAVVAITTVACAVGVQSVASLASSQGKSNSRKEKAAPYAVRSGRPNPSASTVRNGFKAVENGRRQKPTRCPVQ